MPRNFVWYEEEVYEVNITVTSAGETRKSYHVHRKSYTSTTNEKISQQAFSKAQALGKTVVVTVTTEAGVKTVPDEWTYNVWYGKRLDTTVVR